ncbi:MbnP family copper-binding protein [Comamonas sp. JC664]|uniref:MbnP family copper-binding protein n=1 Tax=Comamonas sp. JC664 TaxID=2801917 RepID=UPI00174C5E81|nr:MbnP family copper-binding protein [Comamonas sp. JC664]MBL0697336.1 metallo-mystery pair system four-Cys motif protein [Comamonas sp. JC664]GHG67127.1 metallo-mystery pair system four-Cys motif protein [Comamonas sp. KCTC 72670]
MPLPRRHAARCLSAMLLGTLGCGIGSEPDGIEVVIPFEARVGSEPFACGRVYSGLGTTGTTYEPMEYRLYLHDLRLVTAAGAEVALRLDQDSVWQREGTVLLDFADKSGLCTNGTQATNHLVRGRAPAGEYTGVRFKVGVPASLNHLDASTAPAPLNDMSMFWSWRSGYLFMRIEGRTEGLTEGHFMHLGSTNCAPPPEGQTQGTAGCEFGNRPEVALDAFDLERSKVVMDLKAFYAGTNLDVNANVPNTAIGCMSQPTDPDCIDVFARLGLSHPGQPQAPGPQSFFQVE